MRRRPNWPCSGGVKSATAAPAEKVGEPLPGLPPGGVWPTGGPWPGGVIVGGRVDPQPLPPESLRAARARPPRATAVSVTLVERQWISATRRCLRAALSRGNETAARPCPSSRGLRGRVMAVPCAPMCAARRTWCLGTPVTATFNLPLRSTCDVLELTIRTCQLVRPVAPAGTSSSTASAATITRM